MEVHDKPLPASAAQNLHLDGLYRDIEEVLYASEALFASLTPLQLTWKPGRNKWSIFECFDHLLTTNGLYMEKVHEAMERGRVNGAEAIFPFKPSLFGRWFIGALHPDSKFTTKTLRIFKPDSVSGDLTVTTRFVEQLKALRHLIKEADQCDLNHVKLSSPASRFIRFSIGEALTLTVVHNQRHLLQAQNIQLLAGFPEFQS